ncbi:unnamed protein product [Rotaria socialis]|uniref:Uncharacterized protein n=1 Tax=Rotaria socialis TaxID=392032 RepID=A0A820U5A1_9BILA|nr:unnamed protein product [Rotaria socialis]CAF4476647.1 unnamed protein product [Rotaria socialis]
MATSINKCLRKRYKGKFLALNEDSLLCETCFTREQRRTPGNKKSIVSSPDDEYNQNISSGLLSDTPSNKRLCLPSISLIDLIETPSSSGLSHSTPVVTDNQPMMDVMHNISSTDMSSPSDIETECNFISKTAKEQLNGLLDVFSLSPIKDARHTVVAQEKCQILLKKTKILSDSLISSSSSSTTDTTNVNSIGYEDMEQLVYKILEWDGRMAKELYESSGVLAAYENNQDRVEITPSTIEAVVAYYQDDIISRSSSNTKDTINVKQSDGKKKPLYPKIDLEEEVNWMKWINLNGKTDIHRLGGSVSDLLMEMDHQWSKFIIHSYITKAQFDYIRNLKQSLPPDTALIHMDFAENYALEVQNEVMSKHWSTAQAALFTIQIRTKTEIVNIVIVSNYLSHDTIFVSCGQRMICDYIRTFYPLITKIVYLSDGCSAHFKNNFSMLNLIKHNEDYQYKAEWIFYSTSHGKGPVDGLGAVVKSAARRETMRADGPQKSFLTPVEFYKFLKQKFCSKPKNPTPNTSDVSTVDIIDTEKIQIWYLSETDINQHFDKYLSQRSETRPPTGSIFDFSMTASRQSKLTYVKLVMAINDINMNDNVAVEYQGDWWLAMVQALETNLQELRVSFLHPPGPRTSFKFPVRSDELNIELGNVICLVCQPPKLDTRFNYMIPQSLCDEIQQLFAEF